ncbi:MAG TPA: hypothetical protein PL001_00090 [Candidatus Kryptobacter bacterium]|nr:hypothetical protein [Candidatus Kryptobacter bacterium]
MPKLLTLERQTAQLAGYTWNPEVYVCEASHFCGSDVCSAACMISTRIDANSSGYETGLSSDQPTIQNILNDYLLLLGKGYGSFQPDNSAAPLVNQIVSDTNQSVNQVYYTLYELYYSAQDGYTPSVNVLSNKATHNILQGVGNLAQGTIDAIQNLLKNLGTVGAILPWLVAGGAALYVFSWLPKKRKS